MIVDVHCHYTFTRRAASDRIERFSFEPARGPVAISLDSYVAPRLTRRLSWRIFQRMLGVRPTLPPGEALDQRIEQLVSRHLLDAPGIDRFVLLAFDEYHDRAGRRPPTPLHRSQRGSDMYTSNSLVRAACRAYPHRFLFGASVHPYRDDAVACVEEVFDAGACLLKWLPLNQNIDVTDGRTLAVLRCCARLGLPILVHYNAEFTLTTQHPEFVTIEPLLLVLRRLRRENAMPITIVAHVATPVHPLGDEEPHRLLLDALAGEFADAPLFADISALTTWGKVRYLRQLARRQSVHAKLLFGTDFPVPPAMGRLRRDLGTQRAQVAALPSWPEQVLRVCRSLCFNEIVFHRAAELLPNVHRFAPSPPVAPVEDSRQNAAPTTAMPTYRI